MCTMIGSQHTVVSMPQFMPLTINRASWFSTDFNSLFNSQRRTISTSASDGRHKSRGRPRNRKWDTYTHTQTHIHTHTHTSGPHVHSHGRHKSRGRPRNRKWDTYTHTYTHTHEWTTHSFNLGSMLCHCLSM